MKSLFYVFSIIVIGSTLFLSGCELITNKPDTNRPPPPGNNLIVSEVFTLSPDKYYDFSWIEVYNPTRGYFQWFYQQYPIVGVVVGDNGSCYYTDDDGETWSRILSPAGFENRPFNDVSFSVADSGIIVADNGAILKIKKSGQSFTILDSPVANPDTTKKTIRDVILLPHPAKAGFAVGDSGLIMRTTNRGATWLMYNSARIPANLNAFAFVALDKLYAVGDSAAILKKGTTGLVWNKINPPDEFLASKPNFYSVFFTYDTGIIVGANGAIAVTKNAGAIWNSRTSPTTSALRGIFFGPKGANAYNYKVGWVVGDNGTILKSTDLGETWVKKETPVSANLYKVAFVDSGRGVAIGDGGIVLNTYNGGETWKQGTNFTTSRLTGVHFNPANVRVRNRYVLEMYAKRKPFFNIINYVNPDASVVNYDDTLNSDVGIILFDPQLYLDLPTAWYKYVGQPIPPSLLPIFGPKEVKNVSPGGFTVIRNDSVRFDNHIKLGPGIVNLVNASIAYVYDDTATFGVRWYKWDLLPQGEIRLVKYLIKEDRITEVFLGYDKKTIDVVRWGNYMPTSWHLPYEDVRYQQGDLYDNNKPVGYMPEWYSMVRYANDMGQADPANLNTSESFYFAKDPIPGWYSQRRK